MRATAFWLIDRCNPPAFPRSLRNPSPAECSLLPAIRPQPNWRRAPNGQAGVRSQTAAGANVHLLFVSWSARRSRLFSLNLLAVLFSFNLLSEFQSRTRSLGLRLLAASVRIVYVRSCIDSGPVRLLYGEEDGLEVRCSVDRQAGSDSARSGKTSHHSNGVARLPIPHH
jgi:hypothetical protein